MGNTQRKMSEISDNEKENILKKAPLNANQYNTDLDNQGTQDMSTLKVKNTFELNDYDRQNSNKIYLQQQPDNYQNGNDSDSDSDVGCFDKVKRFYTNPETPCQNYVMWFLTLVFVIVVIFLLYSLFAKG